MDSQQVEETRGEISSRAASANFIFYEAGSNGFNLFRPLD